MHMHSPSQRKRWETSIALSVPAFTLAVYAFAYFYEFGYLEAFQLTGPLMDKYIAINWSLAIPVLFVLASIIIGTAIWMVPVTTRKPLFVIRLFGGTIDAAALLSLMYLLLNGATFLLPSKWLPIWLGNALNTGVYIAGIVITLSLLRAFIRYLANNEKTLFDYQSRVATWALGMASISAFCVAAILMGRVYGYFDAMNATSYQILTNNGQQYAVIRRYGSDYVTIRLDKNRDVYIINADSLPIFRLERMCIKNLQNRMRMQIQSDCAD